MPRPASIVFAAMLAATGAATAAIGDNYVRVVYCSGSDGGEHVYYGAGTCAGAEILLADFGHVYKSCQQLVVVGTGTLAGNYIDILSNPKTIASGPLVNLGGVGQGVTIVWRPDGLPHAARVGPQGIELAPLHLPGAQNGAALENFIVRRGGQPTRWIDDTIYNVQGDFEIFYETPNTGANPARAPFTHASLQFSLAQLPCNPADLAPPHDVLDLSDVNVFISGFVSMDQSIDLNADQILDLADISIFINAFLASCP